MRALLAGADTFEERFGLAVEEGLDVFPGTFQHILASLEAGQGEPDWGAHLFVDTARATVLGFGGYKGPPRDGAVEIGYAVAPPARRRGVATAAARQLVERARALGAARCVTHTLPEANPSTTVLERCGFSRVGDAVDPDEGPVWRWELALAG